MENGWTSPHCAWMRGSRNNSEVCFFKSIFYIINIFSSRNQWNNKSCLIVDGLPPCRYSCKRGNRYQGVKTNLVCLVSPENKKEEPIPEQDLFETACKREKRSEAESSWMGKIYSWYRGDYSIHTAEAPLQKTWTDSWKELKWLTNMTSCSNHYYLKCFWNSFVTACF